MKTRAIILAAVVCATLGGCSRKVVTTEVFVHEAPPTIMAPKTIVFTKFEVDSVSQVVNYEFTHNPPTAGNGTFGQMRCIAYDHNHNAVGHMFNSWNSEGRMPDYEWGNFKVDGDIDSMTCNVTYP